MKTITVPSRLLLSQSEVEGRETSTARIRRAVRQVGVVAMEKNEEGTKVESDGKNQVNKRTGRRVKTRAIRVIEIQIVIPSLGLRSLHVAQDCHAGVEGAIADRRRMIRTTRRKRVQEDVEIVTTVSEEGVKKAMTSRPSPEVGAGVNTHPTFGIKL